MIPVERATVERAALGVLLLAAALVLVRLTRDTTLWIDEWQWALERRETDPAAFLRPHNGHFSLVPLAIYKLLFVTAGLDDYAPYRAVGIAANLLCGALLYVYARRRVGGAWALLPAALLLTFGPGWEMLLWPFQIGWLVSLAAALGALLMLDRADRAGDVAAACLLGVALASSGLGVVIAAGLAVDLLVSGRGRRSAWIVAAPLALYAVWWLGYQDTGLERGHLLLAPRFAAESAAAAFGALAGLGALEVGPSGQIDDGDATLAWGRPLAVAAAAILVWSLARRRTVPARVFALLTMAGAFWLLTGVQRAHLGAPDSGRYLYVGALLILLVALELARDVSVPRPAALVVVALAGLAMASNLGVLRTAARYLRIQAEVARADAAALELARPALAPDAVAGGFPGTPFIVVRAGPYFAAADALGSPAFSTAELMAAAPVARATADAELVRSGAVVLGARGRTPAAGTSPHVDAAAGGTAVARGPCVRFRPSGESAPGLELTVPPAGLSLSAAGGPATVAVRRFGDSFVEPPLGRLPPATPVTLRVRADRAPQPWHVRLAPDARVTACSLAERP